MYLKELHIANFKNYVHSKITFCEKLNLTVGHNGAGKTNLLDAIYYLCFCKSYFSSNELQNIRHDQDYFRLDGLFKILQTEETETIVAKIATHRKKSISRNDIVYQKLSEHIGLLPLVFVAPDDLQLIKAGSEGRRRLIDSTLSQLDQDYLNTLIGYNKLIQQRNSLLKQFHDKRYFNQTLLDTYNLQLEPLATQIYESRVAQTQLLLPLLQEYYECISSGKEQVNCRYKSALKEQNFGDLLKKNTQQDRYAQRTTEGIHRDDWVFEIDGYPLKKYGSQGQQKSFLIALKLAIYQLIRQHKNILPILLLDDIFDKLDELRTTQLIETVMGEHFGQIFISDTQLERMKQIFDNFEVNPKIFRIEDGTVEEVKEK
ncbi:MAG: DNA replication and repair protein RecF [Chitinophagales bacterium]